MLEFHKKALQDIIQKDGLLLMAKGLGIDEIIVNIMKAYCDPHQLVFILNTKEEEQEKYMNLLSKIIPRNKLPKTLNTDFQQKERKQIYLNGGCIFVTSRILIVDLLSHRIPNNLVSGVILCNAHKMFDDSNETFILRLLKQNNKELFIKAFSEQEYNFSIGFSKLEKMLKLMFIQNIYLYPRFRKDVMETLDKNSPDVIEIKVGLTKNMRLIQNAMVSIIKSSIEEIKRQNIDGLDLMDLDVNTCLLKSFDYKMKTLLTPFWDKIGKKTKGLIEDIKLLKNLLFYLIRHDSYSFFNYIENIKNSQESLEIPSNWILLDDAQVIFQASQDRVFHIKNINKKQKTLTQKNDRKEDKIVFTFEENPKWQWIKKIVEEIKQELKKSKNELLNGTVLIITKLDSCSTKIKEYLELGGREMMMKLFDIHQTSQEKREKMNIESSQFVSNKDEKRSPKKRNNDQKTEKLLQEKFQKNKTEKKQIQTKLELKKNMSFEILTNDSKDLKIVIQTTYQVVLNDLKPSFIILYDSDISIIRNIEIFKANHPGHPCRIYFMMYENSIEEQIYLNSLKSEISNYKKLIQEQSQKIESEKLQEIQVVENDQTNLSKVIVDVREFRASLPSILHQNNYEVIPLSISVGDYIVSPKISLERKSTSDLIQSLTHGRLFTQTERMLKYYQHSGLLIQFEENETFQLVAPNEYKDKIQGHLVTSKLALLTIHFPKLKVFWARNPKNSVEIVKFLKKGQEEPDPVIAQSLGELEGEDEISDTAVEFLKRLPGITPQNIKIVMNSVNNLKELSNLSYPDLSKMLGKQNACLLYDFLNQDYFSEKK